MNKELLGNIEAIATQITQLEDGKEYEFAITDGEDKRKGKQSALEAAKDLAEVIIDEIGGRDTSDEVLLTEKHLAEFGRTVGKISRANKLRNVAMDLFLMNEDHSNPEMYLYALKRYLSDLYEVTGDEIDQLEDVAIALACSTDREELEASGFKIE